MYIAIKAYNKASLEVRSYDAEIIMLQICFALLLLVMFLWKNKQGRKIVESLLIVCVLLSTCTETYMTTSQRGTAYTTTEEIGYDGKTMTNDTIEAIRYLKENDNTFLEWTKHIHFYQLLGILR